MISKLKQGNCKNSWRECNILKYYVCEGSATGDYNASTKARQDVEEILKRCNFNKFFVPTQYGVVKNKFLKIFQFLTYKKNGDVWDKSLNKLKSGDVVIIQYPVLNTTLKLDEIIKKHKKRGVKIIALVHDIDSLRYTPENNGKMLCRRVEKEDREVLAACSEVIAHNEKMKKILVEKYENDESRIKVLSLFDYLADDKIDDRQRKKDDPIIIAGNLTKSKAGYLEFLHKVDGVNFNLYGIGYEKNEKDLNINYKGAFLPEELLNNLEGSFGLVWDGNSINTCQGGFGGYLKYNNPHKASMYLAAGIPIIIWKNAALAEYIEKEQIGFTVESLQEIKNKLSTMSDSEYIKYLDNTKRISHKIKDGFFLKEIIKEI